MVLNIQVLLISLQWINLDMLLRFRLDHEKIGRQMYTLIKQLLKKHFPGDNSFTVEDGENYN